MRIVKDVLAELLAMFLGDLRLSLSTLAVVAAAALLKLAGAEPLWAGALLLFGCLATLVAAVLLAARAASR